MSDYLKKGEDQQYILINYVDHAICWEKIIGGLIKYQNEQKCKKVLAY